MKIKRWLTSLTGQVILVALFALLLIQLVGIQIYRVERDNTLGQVNTRFTLQRLIAVTRLLNQSPPALHKEILRASRSETLRLTISQPLVQPLERNPRFEHIVRKQLSYPDELAIYISSEQQQTEHFWSARHHHRLPPIRADIRLQGGVELNDGRWLSFTSFSDHEVPGWSLTAIFSFTLLAALLAGLMVWLLQRTTRPLKELAQQAERLGRGDKVAPIAERGPREIQDTLSAFNRMQDRLDRFVSDRTRMLAAISHDLRTPITTLQLRCEFLPEGVDKQKIQQDLKHMEHMLNATLHFAKEEGSAEPWQDLDVPSLLESLCDDLQDNGYDVSFISSVPLIYRTRATVLRRALQNLLDNAVKYGKTVKVSLRLSPKWIQILIEDTGPGIPEDQLEEVFKPFIRLDSARNIEDGSIGLGLAIARTLIHQQGGELQLSNLQTGGLLAQVSLPRERDNMH